MPMKTFWNNANESYEGAEVVDISSTDYEVVHAPARGAMVTTSGNVILELMDGSRITVPIIVLTGHHFELRGYFITKVIKSGTTATVSHVLL